MSNRAPGNRDSSGKPRGARLLQNCFVPPLKTPSPAIRARLILRFLVLVSLLFAVCSCTRVPGRRASLDAVDIRGNDAVDDDEIQEKMASQPTPKFLGFFRGVVYDYEVFDRYVLERDLQRIERYYRARGFYRASARATRVWGEGRHRKVEIHVEEGPPTLVGRVDLNGLGDVPPEVTAAARRAVERFVGVGSRFEEERFTRAEERLLSILGNNGYAYARVSRAANVDLPNNVASVAFWVTPGRLARFGEVRLSGLENIPEEPVRRALDIEPGAPYSQSELEAAQAAVLDLGVFSSVNIQPDITDAEREAQAERVPIKVELEVTKLKSVFLGGGLQADALKTEVHVTGGWEHRNLFGGLRSFRVDLTPGLVLYPTRISNIQAPSHYLPQVKLRTEFRQPGFLEARTAGVIRTQWSIYPLILVTNPQPTDPVLGYRDARLAFGLERALWKLFGSLSHNLQLTSPFTYVEGKPPENPNAPAFAALELQRLATADLSTLLVSYPQLTLELALTDRRVSPREGVSLHFDLQAAGVGGDARDVKVEPEVRGYVPISRKVTLAARVNFGFLFPGNYGDTIEKDALTGGPGCYPGPAPTPGADACRANWVRDLQLAFLRGYFSGGSGSNRGYAPREIGPHGTVPFFSAGQTTAECLDKPETCELPLGGFTLWEAGVELRFPVSGPLSGALFVDTSDVSAKLVNIRLTHPHLSTGVGARVATPVGPVRLDIGYRVPGLQSPSPRTADEKAEPNLLFDVLPVAVSLGIGEAF